MCSQWSRIAMFYNTSIRIVFDTKVFIIVSRIEGYQWEVTAQMQEDKYDKLLLPSIRNKSYQVTQKMIEDKKYQKPTLFSQDQ